MCVFACFLFYYLKPIGYLLILAAPTAKMERRSDRIRQCRERAADMEVHEEEEQVAPLQRGRQNRGNRGHQNQRHGHEQSLGNNIPIIEEVHEEGEEEVEQNVRNDPIQGEEPSPPQPTLVEVMD